MLPFALLFALLPFTAQDLAVPVIRLNSSTLKVSEVVLQAGPPFILTCIGQASVFWKTRVGLPNKYISQNVLTVKQSTPDHTGTYKCSYKNQTDLFSEIHIYVKDSANIFTTPLNAVIITTEGSDCLLDCLLTDPTATEFSLHYRNGSSVLPEMKYTADPKKGIVIRDLQPSYDGEYVCTVKVNRTQRSSEVFAITVNQKVKSHPSVSIEMNEYVQVVGGTLKISCHVTNRGHYYHVKWMHSSKLMLSAQKKVTFISNEVHTESVLTLPNVSVSDSGNLTCTGINEAGQNNYTVSLRVVDTPYIALTPVLKLKGHQFGSAVELKEGDLLELRVHIDAYPPIEEKWWDTPRSQNMSTYKESFYRIPKSYRYMANFTLERIRPDESGWYIFNARSACVNASTQFKVYVYEKPSVVVNWKNDTLTCIATGYPAPTIQWQQCEELQSMADRCKNNYSSRVELSKQSWRQLELMDEFKPQVEERVKFKSEIRSNMSVVQCVASNIAGEGHATYYFGEIYLPSTSSEIWTSKIFTTMLTGTTVVSCLLLVLLGVCVYRCKQKPKYEIRWKIIEANEGNNYTYIDPHQLPYNNTQWEFPRDRLTFGQVLGAGAFGKVIEATAYGLDKDEHVTRVAVKMLKSSAHSEEKEALMSELKILSHIGSHANIVNLLGACTEGGPVLLITEYCSHGDLLNFLRRRAQLLLDLILQDQVFSNVYRNLPVQESLKRHSINSYQDMSGQRANECSQGFCSGGEKDLRDLDIDDLLRFSNQVAQGMEFLVSKNCIHRDVAARNILVTESFVAKICDFGLARDIMNDPNYVVRGNARLPVKWMSPESIFECIYTVQSDVWSYGILLWEIFSLGRSPYPDVAVDARFYKMIKGGCHMTQPDFAPTEMYTIMKMCWSLEPTLRPTFGNIVHLISKLLPEYTDQMYKNVNQELQQQIPSGHCVSTKACEEPCDQMTSHEEEQLLMQLNNYQLC